MIIKNILQAIAESYVFKGVFLAVGIICVWYFIKPWVFPNKNPDEAPIGIETERYSQDDNDTTNQKGQARPLKTQITSVSSPKGKPPDADHKTHEHAHPMHSAVSSAHHHSAPKNWDVSTTYAYRLLMADSKENFMKIASEAKEKLTKAQSHQIINAQILLKSIKADPTTATEKISDLKNLLETIRKTSNESVALIIDSIFEDIRHLEEHLAAKDYALGESYANIVSNLHELLLDFETR